MPNTAGAGISRVNCSIHISLIMRMVITIYNIMMLSAFCLMSWTVGNDSITRDWPMKNLSLILIAMAGNILELCENLTFLCRRERWTFFGNQKVVSWSHPQRAQEHVCRIFLICIILTMYFKNSSSYSIGCTRGRYPQGLLAYTVDSYCNDWPNV